MADQPAVRRTTPGATDLGLVVRHAGTVTATTTVGTATGTKSANAAPTAVPDSATLLHSGTRRGVYLQNVGSNTVYLGKSGVSTANYLLRLAPTQILYDEISSDDWYGICDSGLSSSVAKLVVT